MRAELRPRPLRVGGLLVLALGAASCAASAPEGPSPPDLRAGRSSSSIALLASGRLLVVDGDEGAVSALDAASLERTATTPVGGEPHALLPLPDGRVLVATYRGGEVVALDPESLTVTARQAVCAGAFGLALSAAGDRVAVSCEWENRVVFLDPRSLLVIGSAAGFQRPRAVAFAGPSLFVADFTGGRVSRVEPSGTVSSALLPPLSAPYRPALERMTANLTSALAVSGTTLFAAHLLLNHDGDSGSEAQAEDYGSVVDGNPKINPAVTALSLSAPALSVDPGVPALYARFDGGPRAFTNPSALAPFGDRYLLVAHESSASVAVLDRSAAAATSRAVGSFRVGMGPSGIAVDEAAGLAYVDNALDKSVSRVSLHAPFSASAPVFDADATLVRRLPPVYSEAALRGRKIFHDATDPHLTPSGVLACSTCHPGGGDDGLVWFVHTSTIPLKRRRTPHLGNSRTGTEPFHWNAEFPTIPALVSATVTQLMAGDALLVDGDAIRAYIDEIVRPPSVAPLKPEAAARGAALFSSDALGCAGCHTGEAFTDRLTHVVLDPVSLSNDDGITAVDTPGLRGVALRPPYLHDGRSPSLDDLFTRPDASAHRGGAPLSDQDRADLISFLESLLPG